MQGSQIFHCSVGRSVEGRDIPASANFDLALATPLRNSTLVIGGTHGDEPATVVLMQRFVGGRLWSELAAAPTIVIPLANPDGYARGTRYNARGVDPNRNFGFNWRSDCDEPPGPAPWSEPESVALRDFILRWQPAKIVSLHWALAEIDADGTHSTALAQAMWDAMSAAQRRPYRLRVTEVGRGQRRLQQTYAACPGSLGQWCGYGLEYADGGAPAMITLELPYDPAAEARPDELPEDHLADVHDLWRRDSERYLRGVEPGVTAMLRAACLFPQSP